MTTINTANTNEIANYADNLRRDTIAVRVHHEKMGVRKALSKDQIQHAAEVFHAEVGALNASKRLIDTRHPAYREVVGVRRRASEYWKAITIPYPETGVRLLRRARVGEFDQQMSIYRQQLIEKVAALQAAYAELRQTAMSQLGTLFNSDDYPERIDTQFAIAWDYPSIEPPGYLKQIHPELYEQECERIRVRFEEAVNLTEQAFLTKFADLVSHLADRLVGETDGKPKIFRDTAVKNLNEFFESFRDLNVGSSGELDRLVTQAQQVVAGVSPDDLRGNEEVRASVGAQLSEIQQALDGMMINRPKRAINLEDDEEVESDEKAD